MVGPQGPPGEAGDLIVTDHLAGEALGGHRGVIVGNDNRLYYADQSNLTHFNRVLGITTGAAVQNDPASVRVGGIMTEPSWTWDLDKFIYLGVNGLLTQTPPGTGFLLEMGWPINPTSMMVDIKLPLFLASQDAQEGTMAQKFLRLLSGVISELEALVTSAGAGDAGKIPALDATGKLDNTLMPVGIGADTKILPASENLAAGDLVNVWNDSGTAKARKADATTAGKEANGFVLSAVTLGNNATVYFDGTDTQLSSLTPGAVYYLATTAGGVTDTPPSGSGNVLQRVGRALSATELTFEPGEPITLA